MLKMNVCLPPPPSFSLPRRQHPYRLLFPDKSTAFNLKQAGNSILTYVIIHMARPNSPDISRTSRKPDTLGTARKSVRLREVSAYKWEVKNIMFVSVRLREVTAYGRCPLAKAPLYIHNTMTSIYTRQGLKHEACGVIQLTSLMFHYTHVILFIFYDFTPSLN